MSHLTQSCKKCKQVGKAKVLSEAAEFKLLLLVAKEGAFGVRNVALVYCSFGLGLRAKEIALLTIADIAKVPGLKSRWPKTYAKE